MALQERGPCRHHYFSRTTNAIRVTPREKHGKSYMFILDTPEGSEHGREERGSGPEVGEIKGEEEFYEVDGASRQMQHEQLLTKYLNGRMNQGGVSEEMRFVECSLCQNAVDTARLLQERGEDYIQLEKRLANLRGLDDTVVPSVAVAERYVSILETAADGMQEQSEIAGHLEHTIRQHSEKLAQLQRQLDTLRDAKRETLEDVWNKHRAAAPAKEVPERTYLLETNDWLNWNKITDNQSEVNKYCKEGAKDSSAAIEDANPKVGEFDARVDAMLHDYQKMALKPKHWVPKITVPQPFNMTIRDHAQLRKETLSDKRIEEYKQQKEGETKIQIHAVPLPNHVKENRFEQIMAKEEARRQQVREESKEMLLKSQRPFSFWDRDKQVSARTESRHAACLLPASDDNNLI